MSEDSENFIRDLGRAGFKKRKNDDVWQGEVEEFCIMRQSEHYFALAFKVKRPGKPKTETIGESMDKIMFVHAPIGKFELPIQKGRVGRRVKTK